MHVTDLIFQHLDGNIIVMNNTFQPGEAPIFEKLLKQANRDYILRKIGYA